MDIAEAKKVRLIEYLASLGFQATKVRGVSYWYISPFRQERTPSFKVNDNLNEWYDFGIGKGGDIIDLGRLLFNLPSVSDVLRKLCSTSPQYPSRLTAVNTTNNPTLNRWSGIKVITLSHPALLTYLRLRGIDLNLAQKYCSEIHYKFKNKDYFGIAFENRSKGYEIRNSLFKGCMYNKDITILYNQPNAQQRECCVFEGFIDFLSFLTITEHRKESPIIFEVPCDYIVLNSVSNIAKCTDFIGRYANVHSFLDNDKAGWSAFQYIHKILGVRVVNESVHYEGFKDLNDYLLGSNL